MTRPRDTKARDVEPPPLDEPLPVDYESRALERGAYVTAIIHLYRGEVARANTWRMRLDQTTNWAIFTTASALGFAFGDTTASHLSLQFANVLLFILLMLEARRFRFFDVWRARIRMIEVNFFAPILERRLESPEIHWGNLVAYDLSRPRFHLTRRQALRQRLVRNYIPIFGVVFLGWMIKLAIHPMPFETLDEVYRRCAVGDVPAWLTLAAVGAFYVLLAGIVLTGRRTASGRARDNWDIGEAFAADEI